MSGAAGPEPKRQPWLHSLPFDLSLILAPALLATIVAWVLGMHGEAGAEESIWAWALLVIGVDVAHVYSTLYRVYFDAAERRRRQTLYTLTPLLCWVLAVMVHSAAGDLWFWRALAYLAVFHFVRQQYGFAMLYRRREAPAPWERRFDGLTVYAATLYPLVFWHTSSPRQFAWFLQGDFLQVDAPGLERAAWVAYAAILGAYVAKELVAAIRRRWINVPKNLVVAGTAVSWYVGIVAFDGDLTFTVTNVVAHGVPYVALVWVFGRRGGRIGRPDDGPAIPARRADSAWWFWPAAVPAFVGLLVVLAYLEEGLWDAFVWREHAELFPLFTRLPHLPPGSLMHLVVPLLAVPQMTHYVLDGFIWRRRALTTQRL
jgi:hypothetical protein